MKQSLLAFLTAMAVSSASGCGSATKEAGGTGGHLGGQTGGAGQRGAAGSSSGGTPGAVGSAGSGGTGGSETRSSGHGGFGGTMVASGGAAADHPGGGAGGDAGDHPVGGAPGGAGGRGGQSGAGQAGGQGGQPIDGGQTCAELVAEFKVGLVAAVVCNPGAANQCRQLAPTVLADCAPCSQAWVNDATALVAIQRQWFGACAKPVPCPAISCVAIFPSVCVSTSPTTGGPNAGASPGGVCSVN